MTYEGTILLIGIGCMLAGVGILALGLAAVGYVRHIRGADDNKEKEA